MIRVDYHVSKNCVNPNSSGYICVKCGQCGRKFDSEGFLFGDTSREVIEKFRQQLKGKGGVMFTFPRMKKDWLAKWSLKEQTEKVQEEALEIAYVIYKSLSRKPVETWLEDMAEEAYDTIHAVEVLLQMLEERGVDIETARRKVEEKNRAKGFYKDEASTKSDLLTIQNTLVQALRKIASGELLEREMVQAAAETLEWVGERRTATIRADRDDVTPQPGRFNA